MDENIMNAINTIRNKDKKKPSTEKIFNFVKKTDPNNITIEFFKERLLQLEDNGYVTCKGDGKDESYFILKPLESLSDVVDVSITNEEDVSMTAEDNMNFIQEMFDEISNKNINPRAKSSFSTSSSSEKFYERIISELKSENRFLRDMLLNLKGDVRGRENEEILFLRKELEHKNKLLDQFILQSNSLQTCLQKPGAENLNCNKIITPSNHPPEIQSDGSIKNDVTNTHVNTNVPKPKCVVIGDSIIKGLNEREIRTNNHEIKIKSHPGASSEDLLDYIKPELRKSPEKVIIHVGTNDLKKNIKTIDNIKQIIDYAGSKSPNTAISVSLMTIRNDDKKTSSLLVQMNERLKKFAIKNKISYIEHKNINDSCLSAGKLHLNKKGKSLLAKNFANHLNMK